MILGLPYREVWAVDFEFTAVPERALSRSVS
jgi:hypothetical protein